jgi:hypothetical protein
LSHSVIEFQFKNLLNATKIYHKIFICKKFSQKIFLGELFS